MTEIMIILHLLTITICLITNKIYILTIDILLLEIVTQWTMKIHSSFSVGSGYQSP